MKNKFLLLTITAFLAVVGVGCGEKTSNDLTVETIEVLERVDENVETTVEQQGNVSLEGEKPDAEEFGFEDLAKVRFEFCSGAGGWSEEFQIESDGSFSGYFHDSNMGETGDGYPDGTVYRSDYTGHFSNLIQINEYTYQMKLADISYEEPLGRTEISDNRFWYYTASYCLGGNDTFTVYLPGTPLSEISEGVYSWLRGNNESDTELTMLAIVDESNEYGIYSCRRRDALEQVIQKYHDCKETYDSYRGLISEAEATMEMLEYNMAAYECSDDCLNYIWDVLRYELDEDKFAVMLEEQRAWIKEKEAKAEEDAAEFGESFARVIYYDTLAEYTINRCAELVEYLKQTSGEQQAETGERTNALEDAQMTFNSYKESFDYYGDLLAEALTTVEMAECTGSMYEIADDCLNYIWNLIRDNVEEEEYAVILEEQRAWIAEKEAKADEAASVFDMGTLAQVSYNDVLAHITMERCEELIEYLK